MAGDLLLCLRPLNSPQVFSMKAKRAGLVLSVALVLNPLPGMAAAQQEPPSQQPQATPSQTAQPGSNPAKTTTIFGKIIKQSGTYVLVESASKEHYALDDQKTAKKYNGRAVYITGTVDVGSKSVHVQTIEAAA
jgi:hypothetical protein